MRKSPAGFALLFCLLAVAPPLAAHQLLQISDSPGESHLCRVASSPWQTIVVAWVEEGSGVWTRTWAAGDLDAPVFHGPGTHPDVGWAEGGFFLVWADAGVIHLREGSAEGVWDTIQSYDAPASYYDWPRVTGWYDSTWVHGVYVTWQSGQEEAWFLERDQGSWQTPELVMTGGEPWAVHWPQALPVIDGGTHFPRVFVMTEDTLVYCDRSGGLWGDPVPLHPGLSYFGGEFMVTHDSGDRQHVLSNGPTPTCPCNVIMYSTGTSAADWTLPEDLTYYFDSFTWPQSPAIGVDVQGDVHLFWFQQHYNSMMDPSFSGCFYYELVDGNWENRIEELQGHFGKDTDLDIAQDIEAALVWSEGYYEGEGEVWLAFSPLVDATPEAPAAELALRVHPNPFNPKTTLRFDVPRATEIRLDLIDPSGRLLRRLAEGRCEPGEQVFHWDGRDAEGRELPSGIYLARLATARASITEKLVLLR